MATKPGSPTSPSRPDVVVLDYQMPGKTGIEVFLLIRQLDKKFRYSSLALTPNYVQPH